MNNYICENGIIIKNGITQCIQCKALKNDLCCCMRYCPTKKSIEHTEMAQYCKYNPNKKEYKK